MHEGVPAEQGAFDAAGVASYPGQADEFAQMGVFRINLAGQYGAELLLQLPRLALQNVGASHYLIRKAHRPDQLSTLEATCAALAQLHGGTGPFQPLIAAFDGFVARQMGHQTVRGSVCTHAPDS